MKFFYAFLEEFDHFYDESKMTLVSTPASLEWKFPFIFIFSTLTASAEGKG